MFATLVTTSARYPNPWLIVALACGLGLLIAIPAALALESLRGRRDRAGKAKDASREIDEV